MSYLRLNTHLNSFYGLILFSTYTHIARTKTYFYEFRALDNIFTEFKIKVLKFLTVLIILVEAFFATQLGRNQICE